MEGGGKPLVSPATSSLHWSKIQAIINIFVNIKDRKTEKVFFVDSLS